MTNVPAEEIYLSNRLITYLYSRLAFKFRKNLLISPKK